MSDSDNDASVLGKRPRDGQEPDVQDAHPDPMDADDSDDDVGPMPMPAGAEGHVVKKKRKGAIVCPRFGGCPRPECVLVLPHEKLYLEHLPCADRYYKSFMHRDVVNFNVFTRYCLCDAHSF